MQSLASQLRLMNRRAFMLSNSKKLLAKFKFNFSTDSSGPKPMVNFALFGFFNYI